MKLTSYNTSWSKWNGCFLHLRWAEWVPTQSEHMLFTWDGLTKAQLATQHRNMDLKLCRGMVSICNKWKVRRKKDVDVNFNENGTDMRDMSQVLDEWQFFSSCFRDVTIKVLWTWKLRQYWESISWKRYRDRAHGRDVFFAWGDQLTTYARNGSIKSYHDLSVFWIFPISHSRLEIACWLTTNWSAICFFLCLRIIFVQ